VTTGPWHPRATGATGHGRLRASDADREHVIDALKDAFVQGRLAKDELDMRAEQALTSRTYADLTAITADIPVRLPEAQPLANPARVHPRQPAYKKAIAWGLCGVILTPTLGAAFLTYYGGFLVLFLFAFIGLTITTAP
jgi:Domain of unknown function (DUF1707)